MSAQPRNGQDWEGRTMLDRAGEKIGTIEDIYLVEETGQPEWALVRLSRRAGRGTRLVPLTGADPVDNGIRAAYEKAVVGEAPRIDAGSEPSQQQVAAVYRHYGLEYGDGPPQRAVAQDGDGESASQEHTGSTGDAATARPPGDAATARPPGHAATAGPRGHAAATARPRSAGGDTSATTTVSTLKRTVKEFSDDNLTHWAAALTYYAVLSIFPALLAVVSILGLIGSSAIQPLIDNLTTVAPGPAKEILTGALNGLQEGGGSGLLFVLALAGAIWSASGYISAFMDASNAIYDVEEGRPIWKKLPLRIGITVLMLVLLAVSAGAVVLSGPVAEQAGKLFGVSDSALAVWDIAKWPVLVLIAAFMFAVLYYSTPNVRQPGLRALLPGGVLAVILWIVASAAFALYVASFGSYNKTYGALGGVIVFLVWLWLTNLAILLGAEFNAERARGRNIAAGQPPDREPYLPFRSRP